MKSIHLVKNMKNKGIKLLDSSLIESVYRIKNAMCKCAYTLTSTKTNSPDYIEYCEILLMKNSIEV